MFHKVVAAAGPVDHGELVRNSEELFSRAFRFQTLWLHLWRLSCLLWCLYRNVMSCRVPRSFSFRWWEKKGGVSFGSVIIWQTRSRKVPFWIRRSQLSMEQSCCTDLKRWDIKSFYHVHPFLQVWWQRCACSCIIQSFALIMAWLCFQGGKPGSFCSWLWRWWSPQHFFLGSFSRRKIRHGFGSESRGPTPTHWPSWLPGCTVNVLKMRFPWTIQWPNSLTACASKSFKSARSYSQS